ncbi:MAG: ATP-binding protein [Henriciella sp.]|nr:ATP-binding protein [Henriciella sp.]MBO6696090.1 ATP-binding protein [Henriciella sp.]
MSSTRVGQVGGVNGPLISVRLSETVSSGIMIIGGRSYRVAQVGSFVRIPQGYQNLYGIISEVGASATPESESDARARGDRWMTVQLVGEIIGAAFERGISQFPSINDEVHLVTEEDLAVIYGGDETGQIEIGSLANAESIPVRLDLDKLVTRHSALLGSTGAGKSTSVASILRSICAPAPKGYPSARVLLLDIHGEYASALSDVAKVFRALPTGDELPLHIPYWALPPSDMLPLLMGHTDDRQMTAILDKIVDTKITYATNTAPPGINVETVTADTPLPYSLRSLWYELIRPEVLTWDDTSRSDPALIEEGDAATLKVPIYKTPSTGNTPPFINNKGVLGLRRQLSKMRSKMLDRQFDFLLNPGHWSPNLDGKPKKELPDLLESWIGHNRPVTVLDLSGVPSTILNEMIAGILNIIYEALFWGRNRVEGGRQRPQLIVMEEAHRYLGRDNNGRSKEVVQRIVKEGRKFGVGAMIVSQRPSEVDDTVLSQCGTFLSLRLTNASDRSKVQGALPDNLAGIASSLPILRTGEAIITGEAARLPVRCRLKLPSKAHRPNSEDPEVADRWRADRKEENYDALTAAWRSQNPNWEPDDEAPDEEDK